MTDYLTMAEVLAIHADQVERYGGSQGVRDQGLLDAREIHVFIIALYEANQFNFDQLVTWLRSHMSQDSHADPHQ